MSPTPSFRHPPTTSGPEHLRLFRTLRPMMHPIRRIAQSDRRSPHPDYPRSTSLRPPTSDLRPQVPAPLSLPSGTDITPILSVPFDQSASRDDDAHDTSPRGVAARVDDSISAAVATSTHVDEAAARVTFTSTRIPTSSKTSFDMLLEAAELSADSDSSHSSGPTPASVAPVPTTPVPIATTVASKPAPATAGAPKPATAAVASKAAPKSKYKPNQNSTTARGLCAIQWSKENEGDGSDYSAYWKGLGEAGQAIWKERERKVKEAAAAALAA
ncbi:hypothetical protein FB45DRAFT_1033345 [Roridomyces roridus]|uniref:Uncharacterized protein n=1 Tax=Roridomyces roridus TaxID=1738132 RepID=A0AAD7BF72_9AGAR|nr:hypothetical protein FB45DRAFT_1033345 [Roridomyces roridus]